MQHRFIHAMQASRIQKKRFPDLLIVLLKNWSSYLSFPPDLNFENVNVSVHIVYYGGLANDYY